MEYIRVDELSSMNKRSVEEPITERNLVTGDWTIDVNGIQDQKQMKGRCKVGRKRCIFK